MEKVKNYEAYCSSQGLRCKVKLKTKNPRKEHTLKARPELEKQLRLQYKRNQENHKSENLTTQGMAKN